MQSKETEDIYRTVEPQFHFDTRIRFGLILLQLLYYHCFEMDFYNAIVLLIHTKYKFKIKNFRKIPKQSVN